MSLKHHILIRVATMEEKYYVVYNKNNYFQYIKMFTYNMPSPMTCKPGGSMPHSQGVSNNPYYESSQINSSY